MEEIYLAKICDNISLFSKNFFYRKVVLRMKRGIKLARNCKNFPNVFLSNVMEWKRKLNKKFHFQAEIEASDERRTNINKIFGTQHSWSDYKRFSFNSHTPVETWAFEALFAHFELIIWMTLFFVSVSTCLTFYCHFPLLT